MRHVGEERFLLLHRLSDGLVDFEGEGFGQEDVLAVIFLETGNGPLFTTLLGPAEVISAVIAAGLAVGAATDVDVEAEVGRVAGKRIVGAEVGFARVNGAVTGLAKQGRQSDVSLDEAFPFPGFRTECAGVLVFRFDELRRGVTRRGLAVHDRSPGRRAHAHGVELAEARPCGSEALHARGAVEFVEWVDLQIAAFVSEKRHGGIHQAHVVDEEDDNVGFASGIFASAVGRRSG